MKYWTTVWNRLQNFEFMWNCSFFLFLYAIKYLHFVLQHTVYWDQFAQVLFSSLLYVIKLFLDVLWNGSNNSLKRSDSKERFIHKVDVAIFEQTVKCLRKYHCTYIKIIFSHLYRTKSIPLQSYFKNNGRFTLEHMHTASAQNQIARSLVYYIIAIRVQSRRVQFRPNVYSSLFIFGACYTLSSQNAAI